MTDNQSVSGSEVSQSNTKAKDNMNITQLSKKSKRTTGSKVEANQSSSQPDLPQTAPEQVISTRAYLESTVTHVLQEGMLELARKKPANPLEFLGNYLIKRSKGK